MIDYLAHRQMGELGTDRAELNSKLDAIARLFDIDWLTADGENPLQRLWASRDFLATNELLNFGDAIDNFEKVDQKWLKDHVKAIKSGDEGNRAGSIFELLGLNLYLTAGNKVIPAKGSNPGYDGTIDFPDGSSMIVSIKNHGMTSYEKFFQKNARELDAIFQKWLSDKRQSGIEIRIFSNDYLDADAWSKLKADIRNILEAQLARPIRKYETKSKCHIILKHISADYHPLSTQNVSSVIFIACKSHKRHHDKFIEDLRKGCVNLVKNTNDASESACRVLLVRLCVNASVKKCVEWANDYFREFPKEKVGLIILYQAAVVSDKSSTSLTHYFMPIAGPQFNEWIHPPSGSQRKVANAAVLVGIISNQAIAKVMDVDGHRTNLDDTYSYQRGDIYRQYKWDGQDFEATLSNPAPRIKIHADIVSKDGSMAMEMISPKDGELMLLD